MLCKLGEQPKTNIAQLGTFIAQLGAIVGTFVAQFGQLSRTVLPFYKTLAQLQKT